MHANFWSQQIDFTHLLTLAEKSWAESTVADNRTGDNTADSTSKTVAAAAGGGGGGVLPSGDSTGGGSFTSTSSGSEPKSKSPTSTTSTTYGTTTAPWLPFEIEVAVYRAPGSGTGSLYRSSAAYQRTQVPQCDD